VLNSMLRRLLGATESTPTAMEGPPSHQWPGPRAGARVLFLDFDGVLHPGTSETFEFMPDLYHLLDLLPDLDIVVSSTWRTTASPSYLLGLFRPPYRSRVRDVIGPEVAEPHARQSAIEVYARTRGVDRFLAVDDSAELFRPGCPWLILVPRLQGIGHGNAERLHVALAGL